MSVELKVVKNIALLQKYQYWDPQKICFVREPVFRYVALRFHEGY